MEAAAAGSMKRVYVSNKLHFRSHLVVRGKEHIAHHKLEIFAHTILSLMVPVYKCQGRY